MGRPAKEIFLREGVYYCRFQGNRWSTETANEAEAIRRTQFMKVRKLPWARIKNDFDAHLEIRISQEGNTYAKLTQYYSDADETLGRISKRKHVLEIGKNGVPAEPAKDCKDLFELLDYEYKMMADAKKPTKTLDYYRNRFDALKRYVKRHELDLDTFTRAKAISYPQERLHETVRHAGEVGFNNRSASEATVNKEIPLFRQIWGMWKDEGRLQENVWIRVDRLHEEIGDISEVEPDPYTVEEVAEILRNVSIKIVRDVLLFQCMIGCRPGLEVLRITGEKIEKNLIWSLKKRQWDQYSYSPQAKKFFRENLDGKMDGLDSAKIGKAFVKACHLAGVRIGKPYDLRKTFGTEALNDNKIEVVQKLLRHKQLSTTREFYAKTRKPETDKAGEKMQRKILKKLTAKIN